MRTVTQRCGWGALLITVIGCLGGQTGQPDGCTARSVEPDERIGGVTPGEFATSFEGTHVVTLRWNAAEALAEDVLTLELRRATPLVASVGCGGELLVNVDLELATRDHGVLMTTYARMQGTTGQREHAEIIVQGSRVRLDADLTVVGGELQLSGVLTTGDATLPATTATFPAPEGSGGVGGGGGGE